jgi:hypothetical protein
MITPTRQSRLAALLILTAILGSLFTGQSAIAGTTHYVDNVDQCNGQVPCHTAIMAAVNAALPFDIIEVFPGVYHEAVVFDATKTDIVLQAKNKKLMPVIVAPAGGNAITLRFSATNIHIRDFILEAPDGAAILAEALFNIVIAGNVIKGLTGISTAQAADSQISENLVLQGGILLQHLVTSCTLEGNTVLGSGIQVGIGDVPNTNNVIRRNFVYGGDISFPAPRPALNNTVESNVVIDGSILFWALGGQANGVVRNNVVRGGGISLRSILGGAIGTSVVESNVVSGSPGDGIALLGSGGLTVVKKNTAVESAGCDLNDTAPPTAVFQNTWKDNRFGTKCGTATD